jgi:hypothetical protein
MSAKMRSREANVVSIAEIKKRKMIAQYIAFYGYRKEAPAK